MKTPESDPTKPTYTWVWLLGGWLFTSTSLLYWRSPALGAPPEPAAAVDLRSSPARQLRRLPGIGARRAAAIVELRWQRGAQGFELNEIPGIGERTEARVKRWLAAPRNGAPTAE